MPLYDVSPKLRRPRVHHWGPGGGGQSGELRDRTWTFFCEKVLNSMPGAEYKTLQKPTGS